MAGTKRRIGSNDTGPEKWPRKRARQFWEANEEYRNSEATYIQRKLRANGRVSVPKQRPTQSPAFSSSPKNTKKYFELYGDGGNLGPPLPSRRRTDAWLARSTTWRNIPKGGWTPVKVLGKGGYGICGLWEYYTEEQPNVKCSCVVKQQGYNEFGYVDARSLRQEMLKLGKLQAVARTDHIVKVYGPGYVVARGTGADPMWDPAESEKPIVRLYLEHCDKGDFEGFIIKAAKHYNRDNLFPEEAIWRIWECLAKACMVMESGKENPAPPGFFVPDDTELGVKEVPGIAHFDIKPPNIFIGGAKGQAGIHQKTEIFKLGDFGMAANVQPNSENWVMRSAWRYTDGWGAPEQLFQKSAAYPIGLQTNIFCVAKCIYALVMRGYMFVENIRFVATDELGRKFWAFGNPLVGKASPPYSKSLIGLLIKCLAHDPQKRPSAGRLLQDIQAVIASFNQWAQDNPTIYRFGGALPPGPYGFSERGPYFPALSVWDEPKNGQILNKDPQEPEFIRPEKLSPKEGVEWEPLGPRESELVDDNRDEDGDTEMTAEDLALSEEEDSDYGSDEEYGESYDDNDDFTAYFAQIFPNQG